MTSKLAAYWKFWLALLSPLFFAVDAALSDGKVTNDEIVTLVGLVVAAFLVLIGPKNKVTNDNSSLHSRM